MAKKKTNEELFRMARSTGENLGRITVESKKQTRTLVRAGRRGVASAKIVLSKAQKRTELAAHETIPQLVREFNKGLRRGMKKRR